MGFTISNQLIRVYQDGIDSIIDNLGKKIILIMPQKETLCPNCFYDGRNKRSSGRYKSSNPNPLGALNKPFKNGQICPVCQGRGKISENGKKAIELRGTVRWNPQELAGVKGTKIIIPTNICRIKTYSTYAEDFKNAIEIHIAAEEPIETNPEMIKCVIYRNIIPRGLKYSRYFESYLVRKIK